MKRTLLLLLAVLMLLPLAACGNTEPHETTENSVTEQVTGTSAKNEESTKASTTKAEKTEAPEPDYKYDLIDYMFFDSSSGMDIGRSVPIKGGSIVTLSKEDLSGKDYKISGDSIESSGYMLTLFDEQSKFLFPLCYDPTCQHGQGDCLAGNTRLHVSACFIANDKIYCSYETDPISVEVYSLDGTLEEKVEFDMSSLATKDGTPAPHIKGSMAYCIWDETLYMDVWGYDQQEEIDLWELGEKRDLNRWIIAFDVDTLKFSVICNYLAADPYGNNFDFVECDGTQLGIDYDNRYAYCINLENGTCTETDCAAVIDQMISNGDFQEGEYSYIEQIYPLSRVIVTGGNAMNYISADTAEKHVLSSAEITKLDPNKKLRCYGETYYRESSLSFVRESDGTLIELSRSFEDSKYEIATDWIGIKSENGLIYAYRDAGTSRMDDEYVVEENGISEIYHKARKYIYVSYEDILDGQIDDPWYYDAETGMFVQK